MYKQIMYTFSASLSYLLNLPCMIAENTPRLFTFNYLD